MEPGALSLVVGQVPVIFHAPQREGGRGRGRAQRDLVEGESLSVKGGTGPLAKHSTQSYFNFYHDSFPRRFEAFIKLQTERSESQKQREPGVVYCNEG
jgi:hypothetical protein